jgi:hypothetical protein
MVTSFISSLRAPLLALAAIAAIEGAVVLFGSYDPFDRSNFLQLRFGSTEPLHRLLIYEKLKAYRHSSPDVIQVGDSSGLHALDPRILAEELPGLRAVNLSCCANTGFQGYHDIARYMLDRNSSIKAVVVYISLLGWPRIGLVQPSAEVQTRMVGRGFTDLESYLNPPSIAYRRAITEQLYSAGGLFPSLLHTVLYPPWHTEFTRSGGWIPAAEPQMTEAEQRAFCKQHFRADEAEYSSRDYLGRRTSYFQLAMGNMHALAQRRGARLVLIADRMPCDIDPHWLASRRAEVAAFSEHHPDVAIFPAPIYEQAPWREYVKPIHIAPDSHAIATRRVARFLRLLQR